MVIIIASMIYVDNLVCGIAITMLLLHITGDDMRLRGTDTLFRIVDPDRNLDHLQNETDCSLAGATHQAKVFCKSVQ